MHDSLLTAKPDSFTTPKGTGLFGGTPLRGLLECCQGAVGSRALTVHGWDGKSSSCGRFVVAACERLPAQSRAWWVRRASELVRRVSDQVRRDGLIVTCRLRVSVTACRFPRSTAPGPSLLPAGGGRSFGRWRRVRWR